MIKFLFFIFVTVLPLGALAASKADAHKNVELHELRGKIAKANRELEERRKIEAGVAVQLRQKQEAVAATLRKLSALSLERQNVQRELAKLEAQTEALNRQSSHRQGQLALLLKAQYQRQDRRDAIQMLALGDNPNQVMRDHYYGITISRMLGQLIDGLQIAAQDKKKLLEDRRIQNDKLNAIEREEVAERNALVAQRAAAEAALASATKRTQSQQQRLAALKRDEQQLSALIQRLAARAAAQKKEAAQQARKKSAQARGREKTNSRAQNEKTHIPVERSASEATDLSNTAFAQLKGKLLLPTSGTITGRYGAAREEGNASWKGVFVRTSQAAPVYAIAAGQIAYAGTLRGYGNLIIVDHGGGYLSVYGNNARLLLAEGAAVRSGQEIAVTGDSGINEESGLYFELRHLGKTFDPLTWVRLR